MVILLLLIFYVDEYFVDEDAFFLAECFSLELDLLDVLLLVIFLDEPVLFSLNKFILPLRMFY